MVCVSRSRLGHGSVTHCLIFFRSQMNSCYVSQKLDTELGHAPTFQARPRDTDHLRPSNLAAGALRSVEHAPSKFRHDPCPVRRGFVAAVKYCVRKARFVAVREGCGTERAKPRPCVGFNTTKAKTCFVSVFRPHNCRPF